VEMTQQYWVWARVAGPILPRTLTSFGPLLLGPADENELPILISNMPTESTAYSHFEQEESHPRVSGESWMRVPVEASSAGEAQDLVKSTWAPFLAAALTLANRGFAYRIEVIGTWSEEGRESDMDAVSAGRTLEYLNIFTETTGIEVAAQLLMKGQFFHDSGPNPLLQSASLLAYYQCIEKIASLIPVTSDDTADEQRAGVIRTLKSALDNKSLLKKQLSAVEVASNGLNRINYKYASLAIERAGRALGMSDQWLQDVSKLGRLRNERLGHARSVAASSDLSPWFESSTRREGLAFELAADFLEAYRRQAVKRAECIVCVTALASPSCLVRVYSDCISTWHESASDRGRRVRPGRGLSKPGSGPLHRSA
jgi:hypothetical protein